MCAGVFLLLLCLEVSHLQLSQAKPVDFICDFEVKRRMDVSESLQTFMLQRNCSERLRSAVVKPCVRIRMSRWRRASFQQRQAFVRGALDALLRSLHGATQRSSSDCQRLVLERLERSVKNLLLIVAKPESREHQNAPTKISSVSPGRDCRNDETNSLMETLKLYRRLLLGPVELLMESLSHTCTEYT